ncbi:MipA/OmpV family protein [uncultured Paraglaciecola sp.]|uniref:MipA/OmpV family protein n=1 Tax=uncultured Paraglaciecola sp. TaxID=1765024 RepID=UPI00262AA03B|nr:MipA/OmpV family protein [uncultured Paraglaciecola sp.]
MKIKPSAISTLLKLLALVSITLCSRQTLAQAAANTPTQAQYTIGLGVASLPEFDGAKENEIRVLPIINIRYGRLTIGGINGIGYEVANVKGVRFSATTGYFRGRNENDALYLRGVGDIDSSITAGMAINKSFGPFRLGFKANRDFSDDVGGLTASLSAGFSHRISQQLVVSIGTSLSWMNSNHAAGVYGISNQQSLASNLPLFEAKSGLKNVGVSLVGLYFIDQHWSITTMLRQSALLGDAKASPISLGNSPYFVMSGFSYKF